MYCFYYLVILAFLISVVIGNFLKLRVFVSEELWTKKRLISNWSILIVPNIFKSKHNFNSTIIIFYCSLNINSENLLNFISFITQIPSNQCVVYFSRFLYDIHWIKYHKLIDSFEENKSVEPEFEITVSSSKNKWYLFFTRWFDWIKRVPVPRFRKWNNIDFWK